jgi:hypothetical protein
LEVTVDAPKSSAPASAPARPTKDAASRLAKLEEKYRRELLPEDERLEPYEAIVRLRRRLGL